MPTRRPSAGNRAVSVDADRGRHAQISRFFGIVIRMNYEDHEPPHFHAEYAGSRASTDIGSLSVLRGELPGRVLGLDVEWAVMHQAELASDWDLARQQLPPRRIAPLG